MSTGSYDKHRMYVDEVGNSDMGNTHNPNHRFLSLTGVVMSLETARTILHPEFESIKTDFFNHHPDEPVIFHRKEMMSGKRPFAELKDSAVREQFNKRLLSVLENTPYTVITVAIDKQEHVERYNTWRYDPYHYCMSILVERYVMYCNRYGVKGDIIAESRGGKEDLRLKKSFVKIYTEGTNYLTKDEVQKVLTSKQLKVKPKLNNVAGLQLADLLAHPSRREILQENNKGVKEGNREFGDRIIEILQNKYDKKDGKIYGKKLLP